MSELFVSALVTFLVVIDPPGCAPIFASLTSGTTAVHRRAMAIRSILIASASYCSSDCLAKTCSAHWGSL